jgi:hypothetical protein
MDANLTLQVLKFAIASVQSWGPFSRLTVTLHFCKACQKCALLESFDNAKLESFDIMQKFSVCVEKIYSSSTPSSSSHCVNIGVVAV